MSLELAQIFRRWILRILVFPSTIMLCALIVVSSWMLVRLDAADEQNILMSAQTILEQGIISQDTVGLANQIRSLGSARKWQRVAVVSALGRVVAEYPTGSFAETASASEWKKESFVVRNRGGELVGWVLWQNSPFARLGGVLGFQLLSALGLTFLLIVAVLRFYRVLLGHSGEIKAISEGLKTGAISNLQGHSVETRTIIEGIKAYERHLDDARKVLEAQKQAQLLGEFAKRVAHDIRSPLSALSVVAQSQTGSVLSDDERILLQTSIRRIREIAEDLLANNKKVSNFNLVEITRGILFEKKHEYPKAVMEFNSAVDSIILKVDKSKFSRCLSNLMNNAVEASGTKGTQKVEVVISQEANGFKLLITDNGPGFSGEAIEAFQAAKQFTSKAEGHGIGLAESRETLKQMGYELRIKSSGRREPSCRSQARWPDQFEM